MPPVLFDDIASVQERPAIEFQIETIRREIQENGESVVGCEELRVLCDDVVLPSNQFQAIASIATDEGWSFTFCPDRSVRFAML